MLALLGVAQLMVVLDATIVNIALPSAQKALHFSTDSRQWVVTAYALAFGSLLLLGGKLGDLFGRKWTFIAGLIGFSLASAIGGLAQSFGMLVAARALQGAFGALLAPSALSLLTVTFADSPDRAEGVRDLRRDRRRRRLGRPAARRRADAVAVVALVPVRQPRDRGADGARRAAAAASTTPPETRPRIDLPGVLRRLGGLFALVYGFSNAETHSWTAPLTIVALAASVVLLVAFVLDRAPRAASAAAAAHRLGPRPRRRLRCRSLLAGAGVFAVFLFLTYFLQQNLGFSPLTPAGVPAADRRARRHLDDRADARARNAPAPSRWSSPA